MAKARVGLNGIETIEARPKKSRQGRGKHSKYAATSRNSARKRYRGQGKWPKCLARGTFLMEMGINK